MNFGVLQEQTYTHNLRSAMVLNGGLWTIPLSMVLSIFWLIVFGNGYTIAIYIVIFRLFRIQSVVNFLSELRPQLMTVEIH